MTHPSLVKSDIMIIETSNDYSVIAKHGYHYVVRSLDRGDHSGFRNPNFMGSEMALRGVLRKGETLKRFIKRDGLKDLRPMSKDC